MRFPIGKPTIGRFSIMVGRHFGSRRLADELIIWGPGANGQDEFQVRNGRLILIVDDTNDLRTALVQFDSELIPRRVARRLAVERIAANLEVFGPRRQLRQFVAITQRKASVPSVVGSGSQWNAFHIRQDNGIAYWAAVLLKNGDIDGAFGRL